jgi:glycosyltransferase involved in cell wall biosynthesis
VIKLILIADPRNLIFGNASTLNRHKVYSEILMKTSKDGLKLGVISFQSRKGFSIELIDNLYSIKISRSLIFQRQDRKSFAREYKALFNTHLLIAGDPWESFLSAFLFSKMTSSNSRIQVQAHGDIGNRDWINLNWRNRIRSLIAFLSLRFATEIRATTELQAKQLTSQYGVDSRRILVVPVPSFYFSDEVALTLNSARPNSLGLVGRIEQDRGLDTFVELTRKLAQVNQDFSVVVVGSGNSRDKLENKLAQFLPPSRISFLGNIDPVNMHEAWNKLGVLVSCAPTESYGRAMRESIVHGVPVWATQSSGAIDLFKTARDGMELLNLTDSAQVLNETYGQLLVRSIDASLQIELLKSDQQVIADLVSSWLEPPVKG